MPTNGARKLARRAIGLSLLKPPWQGNDRANLLRHAAAAAGGQCEEGGWGPAGA